MSTVFVAGNFTLTAGKRSHDPPQYYVYYQTTLQCTTSDDLVGAEIRIYSPRTMSPLPDYTIVNLFGCPFAPSNGHYLMMVSL
ncbi:hypothetical protein K439DRAFT_1196453 [Ramaria rubella]|nr:hypothetical protein K439DRAFT_1196453 [Ramaria rubella]